VKVLALFDGMSCGQIALDKLGLSVSKYYASEIDKYAIEITQKNYPNTIQVGDITKLDPNDFKDVDLILAGSPCQGFSFAGKQLAFDDPRSALFFEFIRLLKAIKPKYFLLENVRMKKEFIDIISEQVSECYPEITFGIEPILINSSLLSAQSRQRLYWTNIPGIEQPQDKGIVLRDILETNTSDEYLAGENLQKNYKGGNQLNPNYKSQANTIHDANGKSGTICAGTHGYANGYVADVDPKYYLSDKAVDYMNRGSKKYTGNKTRAEHYIRHESEKSKTLTANMYKGVPYGVISINKPKQIGTAVDVNGHDILKRVYSPDGKSPTLNTMGGGNREPKVVCGRYVGRYKIDGVRQDHKGSVAGKTKQMLELRRDQKTNNLSTVQKDNVLTKDDVYWRKLTPLECERLQTVPDNYTDGVSNTQRYKMLGNGWTVDVIAHILKNMEF